MSLEEEIARMIRDYYKSEHDAHDGLKVLARDIIDKVRESHEDWEAKHRAIA